MQMIREHFIVNSNTGVNQHATHSVCGFMSDDTWSGFESEHQPTLHIFVRSCDEGSETASQIHPEPLPRSLHIVRLNNMEGIPEHIKLDLLPSIQYPSLSTLLETHPVKGCVRQ